MKVALLSTYDTKGGAAIACLRLANALNAYTEADANVLVNRKESNFDWVHTPLPAFVQRWVGTFYHGLERLMFFFYERSKEVRFAFSLGNVGTEILSHPIIREADVIHMHWTNQGFLSLRTIEKLQQLGKPVVWTLHDMWAFTGGCHYSFECDHYEKSCGNCPYLKKPADNDLSNWIWKQKKGTYRKIHFATCSTWLRDLALSSSLLREFPVRAIPNPIDHEVFKPTDKGAVRKKLGIQPDKKIILIGAFNVSDKRKGVEHLIGALKIMSGKNPELDSRLEILVFGGRMEEGAFAGVPYKVHYAGKVSGAAKVSEVYNSASVFVTPSLADNLPNTIMEAQSCGIPSVAFKVGGIPDMIDHEQNGYLAAYKSEEDLAAGIQWVLEDDARLEKLGNTAREKVLSHFTGKVVANKYMELYKELLNN